MLIMKKDMGGAANVLALALMVMDAKLFFFNDTATTEIYTLSLHDALPISRGGAASSWCAPAHHLLPRRARVAAGRGAGRDRRADARRRRSHPHARRVAQRRADDARCARRARVSAGAGRRLPSSDRRPRRAHGERRPSA